MLDLLILGEIPGTNIQLGFFSILLFLVLVFALYNLWRKPALRDRLFLHLKNMLKFISRSVGSVHRHN